MFRLVLICNAILLVYAQQSITQGVQNRTDITTTPSWVDGSIQCDNGVFPVLNSSSAGSSITYLFQGVGITAIGVWKPSQGSSNPSVYLDGALVGNIPDTTTPGRCDGILYQSLPLENKSHNLTLQVQPVAGSDNLAVEGFIYNTANDAPPSVTLSSSGTSPPLVTSSSSGTSPPLATSSPSGTTSPSVSSSTSKTSAPAGAIAGSVVGGVALLIAGLVALLNVEHIKYLFYSLASLLFGWFAFRARRIVISSDKNLPRTQISLVLTREKMGDRISDTEMDKFLIWRVFNIGNSEADFALDIPCTREAPNLGFATVTEGEDGSITCNTQVSGPAILQSSSDNTHRWAAVTRSPETPARAISAKNETEISTKLALGIYNEEEEIFRPFLVVNEFQPDAEYTPDTTLFIHAFRTNDCHEGRYGSGGRATYDRVTPEEGFQFSKLHPLTHWHFREKDGKLKLDISRNRRADVKKFQHDCKICNDAMQGSQGVSKA